MKPIRARKEMIALLPAGGDDVSPKTSQTFFLSAPTQALGIYAALSKSTSAQRVENTNHHDIALLPTRLFEGKCEILNPVAKDTLPNLPSHFLTRPEDMKGNFRKQNK